MNGRTRLMILQGSPKIHPRRVKLGKCENSRNIEKNNNALSMFLSFTRPPSRDAQPRECARVREGVGERVKHGIRYFPAKRPVLGRGNSHGPRETFLRLSEF
jgi:hypothetical protein